MSPSGSKKWMTCPGSVAMEAGIIDNGSEYADEGTAAHALAAMCLKEGCDPEAFKGRVLNIVNGVFTDTAGVTVGDTTVRQFAVDDGMIEHVGTYVRNVRKYAEGGTAYYEQNVPIGHITGEESATGAADTIVITPDDELQVHDLKYGMGVAVSAEKNPQGLMYLAGARQLYEYVGPFKSYRFVIHQVRLDSHPDEYVVTHDELLAFEKHASARSQIAWYAMKFQKTHGELHDKYLVPGQHCKDQFCKARASCPALSKFVVDAVGADFDMLAKVNDLEGGVQNLAPHKPEEFTELGRKLAVVDVIQDWCKQIRAAAERALIDSNNAPEVITALGHKIVQGKKGSRTWSDIPAAEKLLKSFRLKVESIYDFKVKSPTVLEKLVPKGDKPAADVVIKPRQWEKLAALITQAPGQPSVAPINDKRPPLDMKPSSDDFDAVSGVEDMV